MPEFTQDFGDAVVTGIGFTRRDRRAFPGMLPQQG
jgi:hypothetical protein